MTTPAGVQWSGCRWPVSFAHSLPADLPSGVDPKWLTAVADDLQSKRGRSLIVVGDHLPAPAHALAHAINAELAQSLAQYCQAGRVAGEEVAATVAAMPHAAVPLEARRRLWER